MNTPFKKRESPITIEPIEKKENTNPFESRRTVQQPVKVTSESDRVKYTATMDKTLRKAVKIAAVNKNLQFSQYIEEALREKLQRDGY